MATIDHVRTIWNYNGWAHRQLWDGVMSISEEDFRKPVAYSIGSVHRQVVHVMWAEALWLARIRNEPRIEWTTETHPTRVAVRRQWDAVEANWGAYLDSIGEQDLDRSFGFYSASRGKTYTHTVRDTIAHIVNHGTDHRAQILRLIHDFGGRTFEQDMAFYLREKAG